MTNLTPRQRLVGGAVGALLAIAAAMGFVKPYEGRQYQAYPDVVYHWKLPTICDGHTGPDVYRGQKLTDAECDELGQSDMIKTYEGILPCIGDDPMPDYELQAYLSIAFNIGPEKFCASSIPAKLHRGDHAAACATITEYHFAGGHDCALPQWAHVCGGIPRRRAAERSLCEGGK